MKKLLLIIFILTTALYAETTLNTFDTTTAKRDDGKPIPTREDAYTNGELEIDRIPTKQLNEDPADLERVVNTWDGSVNSYWNNNSNWSLNHAPTASEDAIIPYTGETVNLVLGDGVCNHLSIEPNVVLAIWEQTLTVNGTLTVSGQILMEENNASIKVMGDAVWDPGSSLEATAFFAYLFIYGNWTFNSGANVNIENAFVLFSGSSDSWVRCFCSGSSFDNFTLNKSGGAKVNYSNLSTEDLVINYNLTIYDDSIFQSHSNHDIVIGNDFRYAGTFDLTQNSNTGSIIFNGSDQEIFNYSIGSGIFNNVTINSSISTTLEDDNMDVRGDLTIASGTFDLNGNTVDVQYDVHNFGTITVDDSLNIGKDLYLNSGSVVELSGTIKLGTLAGYHGSANHYNGSIFSQTGGHYYVESIFLYSGSQFNGTGGTTHIYVDGLSNDNRILIYEPDIFFNNFYIETGAYAELYGCTYDLEVNGYLSIHGSFDINSYEINAEYLNASGNLNIGSGGAVNTQDGVTYFESGSILSMVSSSEFNTASGIWFSPSATVIVSGGDIFVEGNFHDSGNVFSPTGGTVTFDGNSDSHIYDHTTFYDLKINKTGATVYLEDDINITRDLQIDSGTFDLNGNMVDVMDNVINYGSLIVLGTLNATYIDVYSGGDLNIDNGGTVNVLNNGPYFQDGGSLTMISGSELNSTSNIRFHPGSIEIVSGGDIYLEGNFIDSDNIFSPTGGSVTFDGNINAEISVDVTFYDLVLNKTYSGYNGLELAAGSTINVLHDLKIWDGTLEMNDNSTLNVMNEVYISNGAGLNAYGDTGLEIYVGGRWVNNNTTWDTTIGYSPGTEVITFNGSDDQYILIDAPQEDFGNLVINKSDGLFRPTGNIHVIQNLEIVAGGWHDNETSLTHYFEGDFYVHDNVNTYLNPQTLNTIVFKGTEDQTVYTQADEEYFNSVIIDKTAWSTRNFNDLEGAESILYIADLSDEVSENRAQTVTLISDVGIKYGYDLIIEEGSLDLNGNVLLIWGDVEINDGGTLRIDEGAELQVQQGYELGVNSGGTLEVLGVPGNLATITHRDFGNYNFNVNAGGTISAEYGLFEYMTDLGVYVWAGANIDPAHSFNYCTFQNGSTSYGNTLLYINNYDDITITGANFPDAASATYNVAKTLNPPSTPGTITMENCTGIFSGETYDFDIFNRIDWTGLPEISDLTIQYNAGTEEIELEWTYPQTVTQFKVYRSTDPYDFSGATVFTTPTVGYSEGATGTNYFYRVTAENTSDEISRKP